MGIKQQLFGEIDFDSLLENHTFKEDSVREVIILPLLHELGYTHETIVRSLALQHPFLKVGSKNPRPITLIPDYVLKAQNAYAWVLDAKAPNQKIVNDDNVEQVYSYAAHPEIRSKYFALCNGIEFSLFRTTDTDKPFLFFRMSELDESWEKLKAFLSHNSFQIGKDIRYDFEPTRTIRAEAQALFDYSQCKLPKEIAVKKRAVKRHFGVHGYFTRQSWDIVSAYIKNFSQKGDVVLDPFGGSGVTAVEALMCGRKSINIDLNPMAVFIVHSLLVPINMSQFSASYHRVNTEYQKKEPRNDEDIEKILAKYPGPKNLPLPKGSDVETVLELFSRKQTAQLALLKSIIKKEKDKNIRDTLMLMFSGMVTRLNLTYHTTASATDTNISGGDASAMRYYRYRIAPEPRSLDMIKYLDIRFKKVLAAKQEIESQCLLNQKTVEDMFADAKIVKGTATDLSCLENESVDYIYTDPPYGKKIPYLDLSIMWNAWLDLDVTENDYKLEAIEGGEYNKTKEDYNTLIACSIQEMYRVLKFDRWLSFVFAHKDPEFWHLIVETCEKCGFQYVGAVAQKNGQTSFKKRQNPFTVLSGQLIINFRKARTPKAILKANLGMNIGEIVVQTIEGIIAKNDGATLEEINNELIIAGLELGFLDLLQKEYKDLTPLLLEKFDYTDSTEKYTIKKDTRFQSHIDVKLRISYYLKSFLTRAANANMVPTFNEVVLWILPLLKNGTTPEHQTILSVLEDIAVRVDEEDGWKLKPEDSSPQLDFG